MANLETVTSQDAGVVSRLTNAARLWVPAADWNFITGTWTFTVASNLLSMVKTDADNTSTAYIPFPSAFSMAIQRGSTTVDRGIKVLGIEVLGRFATADMDAVPTIAIYQTPWPANAGAVPTVAEITSTTSVGAVTAAATVRRITALIAASNRVFNNDTRTVHAEVVINAAATTAVAFYGAFWHYEVYAE